MALSPERSHHWLSLSQTFQCLTGFLKVNTGLTPRNTCSFPTGNKFTRQVCVSQIKHALLEMIYERSAVLDAFGREKLRV